MGQAKQEVNGGINHTSIDTSEQRKPKPSFLSISRALHPFLSPLIQFSTALFQYNYK